jgi:phytoene desaturase
VRRVDPPNGNGDRVHVVQTDRGPETFDLVVSDADVHHTYARLFGQDPRGAAMGRRLERMDWSMSLVLVYFGTRRRYPDLAHHTVVFGPRYQGLLHDVFHGATLPEDLSLYLHAPTITDPSMAPPGGEAFYVLSPVPHLGHAPIDWSAAGPAYADRILEWLEKRLLPGLRENIVTRRIFTPLEFQGELNTFQGSAFSVAPTLTQSAWFRPRNRDPRIPGLYLVGAGTHPGAGLPGVINSAKATARLIAEDLGL